MTMHKIKRILCVVLSVMVILTVCPMIFSVTAEELITEDGFVWSPESTNKAQIIGYKGSEKNIVIPLGIEGRTVTAVQKNAFQNNTTIESVVISETVQYICVESFKGCTSLKSVTVKGTVLALQQSAFEDCTALKEVNLSVGFEEIGKLAFHNCTSLESVVLPEGVKKIDNMAFWGCTALKTVQLPTTLKEIGHTVFRDCKELESLTLYENVTAIGDNAFMNVPTTAVINLFTMPVYKKVIAAGFKGIVLGAPVENPADYEYRIEGTKAYVTKYKGTDAKISVPETLGGANVSGIAASAFKDCVTLEVAYLPNGLLRVEDSAFEGCTALAQVSFPEDFNYIGKRAFYGCTALMSVTVPYTVTNIGTDAFGGLSVDAEVCVTMPEVETLLMASGYKGKVKFVPENDPRDYVYSGNANALVKAYTGSKTKIIIPDHADDDNANRPVTAIQNYGMANQKEIVSVVVPEMITWIGTYGFANCPSLVTVQLPQKIISINSNTFEGCKSLKNINIPASVIDIEEYAFRNCSSLETIVVPEGVKTLGTEAFANDKSLTSITLPSTLESIGTNCFMAISDDAVIYVPDLETKQLLRNSGVTDCSIVVEGYGIESYEYFKLDDEKVVGASKAAYSGDETDIILPTVFENGSATVLPNTLFAKNKNIETLVISEGIEEIKARALYNCSSLKKIVLPSTVTSIGSGAFNNVADDCVIYVPTYEVYELVKSRFSGTVKGLLIANVDDYKFEVLSEDSGEAKITEYLGSSTEIRIPDTCTINNNIYKVAYIDTEAFKASKLTEVEIPDSVLAIGDGAFADCTELVKVKLPQRLVKISDRIFENCTSLKSVEAGKDIAIIGNSAFKNSAIEDFELPPYMFEIGANAFEGCLKLTYFMLPDTVETIGKDAFKGADNLVLEGNTVELGKLITDSGFTGKVKDIPVTNFADYTFTYYQSNTKAKIIKYNGTDSAIAIPAYTENGIPVCTIGLNAFAYNENLKKVIMPDTVTDMEGSVFEACVNVEYLKISNNLYKLGNRSFQAMSSLKKLEIPTSITSIPAYMFRHCYCITELTIPDSVIQIESGVFYFCTGLRKITIPDTVEKIAVNAFDTFDKDTRFYCSEAVADMLKESVITGSIAEEKAESKNESTLTYWRYNSKASLNKLYQNEGGETRISYDEIENAAKISAVDLDGDGKITDNGTFYIFSDGQSVVYDSYLSTEKYPYLVLTVKLPSNEISHNSAKWVTTYSRELKGTNIHPGRGNDTFITSQVGAYKNESGWQTVVISDTASDFISGNWVSVGFDSLGLKPADNSHIWLKEARLLTEAEYESYFASSSTSGSTLVDFTIERNFEFMRWSDLADTFAAYDSKMGTAMIRAKDAASGTYADGKLDQQTAYFDVAFRSVSVEEYPILAIRLKLNNKNVSSGWYSFKTTETIKEDGSLFYDIMKPTYTATDEWQTIIIDCSKNNAMSHMFKGNWISAAFNLTFTGTATEDDIFWVEWAGIFKSVEDAKKASDAKILTKAEERPDDNAGGSGGSLGDFDFEFSDDPDDDTEKGPQRVQKVVKKKKTVIVAGTNYVPLIIGISVGGAVLVGLAVFIIIFIRKRKSKKAQ